MSSKDQIGGPNNSVRQTLFQKITTEGLPPYYIKFTHDKDREDPSFHVHIDAQAILPPAIVQQLNDIGFYADDFDHAFRLMGMDGDATKEFPHDEPIQHLTYKTAEPSAYYQTWIAARNILSKATCLDVEMAIGSAIRSNDEAIVAAGQRLNDILPFIKEQYLDRDDAGGSSPQHPTTLQQTAADLQQIGYLQAGHNLATWQNIAETLNKTVPLIYYIEGELIPFDRVISSDHTKFNQAAFERLFPKTHAGADDAVRFSWEQGIVRSSIFKTSKRRLMGFAESATETTRSKDELARHREVHFSIVEKDTDPRLIEMMGHLGFSAPAIPKYMATTDGTDLVRDGNGQPVVIRELPFTIQDLSCKSFYDMIAATLYMLKEIGGFSHASFKVEPILTFEVTPGLNYLTQMPPVLDKCEVRADVLQAAHPIAGFSIPQEFKRKLRLARESFRQASKGVARREAPTRLAVDHSYGEVANPNAMRV